ncbi:MAG TPA: hypothetical protein VGI10_14635 [Polyangiaceae bacterium]|jgi:hypothetical protein
MAERRAVTLLSERLPDGSGSDSARAELAVSSLDRVLEQVETQGAPEPKPALARQRPAPLALLRGSRWLNEGELEACPRGGQPLSVAVAAEVDRALLNQALRDGQLLLAEWPESGQPIVVGIVQTRPASSLHVSAQTIELDASRELVLRSGSAALRLRSSGDVELVGSRISAVSRGVMRLIGRLLRLN